MDALFKVLLTFHIVGGIIGLLTGFFNVLRVKGDKTHKVAGKLFSISMITAGATSLVLSILHPNYFLFMVGIFTLYMVGTGNRYLYFKMFRPSERPKRFDWVITYTMFIFGIVFIGLGAFQLIKSNMFGIVFMTFGLVGLLFVRHDLKNYRGNSDIKNYWLIAHIQRMVGGFIASLTAFLVVNASYFPEQIPGFVYWLLPTIVFTPFIIYWSRKYEIRKK